MKKLLLLAALACVPLSVDAYWFQRRPTKKQIVYLKTKYVLTHKATLCALAATLGAVGMREYLKYKNPVLFRIGQQAPQL